LHMLSLRGDPLGTTKLQKVSSYHPAVKPRLTDWLTPVDSLPQMPK
jgi:hypothetical protein